MSCLAPTAAAMRYDASPTVRRADSEAGVVCGTTYLVRLTFGGSCFSFEATQFHI